MMTLTQAHAMLPGSILVGDGTVPIARVHSDSRSLRAGDLFVALRGEHFDAHDFLPEAKAAGAVAAIASRGLDAAGLPGLQVADTQQALTELARVWRARIALPLIAVTGSNGKTTVTQMIATMLQAWLGDAGFATVGNLNNQIGVPLTLLRLRERALRHRAAVVELGMNHPGEIAALAELVAPTVALVNNAQREHLEFMRDVEAVARENGAVITALGNAGVAVFPADDDHAPIWRALANGRQVISFALVGSADVTCQAEWVGAAADPKTEEKADAKPDVNTDPKADAKADLKAGSAAAGGGITGGLTAAGTVPHWVLVLQTPAGALTAQLFISGWHNVKNALAATAGALAAGCPLEAIGRGLAAFVAVKGRSQVKRFQRGGRPVELVDDTYNANPDSVRAAIEVLATMPSPRWLVLGDMGEVGDRSAEFHHEVGAYAKARGIESLWTLGRDSTDAAEAFTGGRHFEDLSSLLTALADAPDCAAVLVKGSRFMQMERVAAAILALPPGATPSTDATRPEAPDAA